MASLVLLVGLATNATAQLRGTVDLQSAAYPRTPDGRDAIGNDARGWMSIEIEHDAPKGVSIEGDLVVYGGIHRRRVVDGKATVTWRGRAGAVVAGLMRDRWGRSAESSLDVLGAPNTPFSLVHSEQRLSQPMVRGTGDFAHVSVEGSVLVGVRRQPVPEADQRFGLGVRTTDVVHRGALGDQALALRVAGTGVAVDWSAHVFTGTNRRPTFVPTIAGDGHVAIAARYTDIVQVGGDVETTRADWRMVAEGAVRRGGVDVTGRDVTYGIGAATAEYQRLGAFDGAWNVVPRVDVTFDTRGTRADIPFASSLRGGMRLAQTRQRPWQVEAGYLFDWTSRGHGVVASVEKVLAESPDIAVGGRMTAFSRGRQPGVLTLWRDDLELSAFLRIGVAR